MIAKNQTAKDINTALLATYRKLKKAVNYNSTFYYNMATMNSSILSMSNVVKSMWENAVSYNNKINALRKLLYMKIYDLYSDAINAIKKWNEDIEKGSILLEQYNAKVAEWQKAVAEAKALYAEWETMTKAYNAWYNDIYLPTYQTYEATKAVAYQARDANLALKETTWRNYYNSDNYHNWVETEDFYHYLHDEPTSDPYTTIKARLREIQLYPNQNVVIRTCFVYVYDTDINRHTLKYILRLSRDSLEDGGKFHLSYEYEYDYASPVVMETVDGSVDETGGGPRNIPTSDQDIFVLAALIWSVSDKPNALYSYKTAHEHAVTTNTNVHAQMDQYQANADAYQNQIDELNSKEEELTNQKNDLWDKVVDKSNEYKAKTKEVSSLYVESLKLLWEYQNLSAKTMQDYIAAVKSSIIYNDAVIKAHEEQEKQGKPLTDYPDLPEPFNTFNSQTVPLPDDETPDMPDEPVPVPDDEDTRE